MRTDRKPWIGACLCALLFVAAPVAAQETTTNCQQDVPCKALMQRASERSKSGNLAEALRLYKLAYESLPDPRLLYNIARTLHKQGKASLAAPYYQRFLDSNIQDEEQRTHAREYLNQIPQQADSPLPAVAPTAAPSAATTPSETREQPQARPIYKKWWFWTITGVAVAGVALGVGLGVGLRPQSTVPSDRMVYMPNF